MAISYRLFLCYGSCNLKKGNSDLLSFTEALDKLLAHITVHISDMFALKNSLLLNNCEGSEPTRSLWYNVTEI